MLIQLLVGGLEGKRRACRLTPECTEGIGDESKWSTRLVRDAGAAVVHVVRDLLDELVGLLVRLGVVLGAAARAVTVDDVILADAVVLVVLELACARRTLSASNVASEK